MYVTDVCFCLKLWFFSAHARFLLQLNACYGGRGGGCAVGLQGKEKVEALSVCIACRALPPWVWSSDTSSAYDR